VAVFAERAYDSGDVMFGVRQWGDLPHLD